MASRSLQFKAFRERFDDLVKGVQVDLHGIASRAYAKKLITLDTLQTVTNQQNDIAQRSISLVSSVHTSISVSEDNFAAFVAVLTEEPAVSGLADTLERTLYGLREGPRMEGKVAGSSVGGATAMDLDSGVADTSALSEATNGDMMPPEAELVRPHASSPPYAQTQSSEGGADQSDGDARQSIDQESDGATALATTAHDRMPRVSSSTSISSLEDRYQMRMNLKQKDAAISELEFQVKDLKTRLGDTEREKEQVEVQLQNEQKEWKRVNDKKDEDIQALKNQVEEKDRKIDQYQRKIAELEQEGSRFKEETETTIKAYKEKVKELEQSRKETEDSLARKDAEYLQQLLEKERLISELKQEVARKDIDILKMIAELAECKLREEQQKRCEERREAEAKLCEERQKRCEEQSKAEAKIREEQQKRRGSEAKVEELTAQIAQMKMTRIPEN